MEIGRHIHTRTAMCRPDALLQHPHFLMLCPPRNTASQAAVVIGEHDWSTTQDTQATKKLFIEEVALSTHSFHPLL